jgi:hypothetical protein
MLHGELAEQFGPLPVGEAYRTAADAAGAKLATTIPTPMPNSR